MAEIRPPTAEIDMGKLDALVEADADPCRDAALVEDGIFTGRGALGELTQAVKDRALVRETVRHTLSGENPLGWDERRVLEVVRGAADGVERGAVRDRPTNGLVAFSMPVHTAPQPVGRNDAVVGDERDIPTAGVAYTPVSRLPRVQPR
jgi:hypothetical protein